MANDSSDVVDSQSLGSDTMSESSGPSPPPPFPSNYLFEIVSEDNRPTAEVFEVADYPPIMPYIINLDQPELLDTTQTPTREVIERPGPIVAGGQLEFRGWLINDYEPTAAKFYANSHLDSIRGNRAHILAAVVSATAVENQAVGVVAFGDLNKNRDKGQINKVFFPFTQGEDVLRRELAAIRLAFQQGFIQVMDRQDGFETVDSKPMEVKTFTVVTTNMNAVWAIRDYKIDRIPTEFKLCYKLETLLQDIAEASDRFAKRKVAACLYYAPEGSTTPLILAAINASFAKEIQGF